MVDWSVAHGHQAVANERQRAQDRFKAVLDVHQAAIHVFETLPTIPQGRDAIKAGIRLRRGMDPRLSEEKIDEYVREMFEAIEADRRLGYEIIRGSALIAACGAFEYVLKATFVCQAKLEPAQAARLWSSKVPRPAPEPAALDEMEQWFDIADQLLKKLTSEAKMHQRAKRFLHDYTFLPLGREQEQIIERKFAELDADKFDEAFLIRHCLVHNGGRVNLRLSQCTDRGYGEPIEFQRNFLTPFMAQMRSLVGALDEVWILGQI